MLVRRVLALSLLAAVPAFAQQPAAPPRVTKDAPAAASSAALPSAQSIVDRYVAAIGGTAAIAAIKSYRATGTFEMPAQGLKGDLVISAARPDHMAMTISIPGMGEIIQGHDGTIAWSVNPMQGPRLLEGTELTQMKEDAEFEGGFLRATRDAVSRETVERTTVNGQECYKVKTIRKSGAETNDCFSVATGLLVGSTSKRESAMGTIEATTLVDDYKQFGALKIATRARVQIPAVGAEQLLTFSAFELNAASAAAFARPAAIDGLAKQKP